MRSTYPTRNISDYDIDSIGIWVVTTAKRWKRAVQAFLKPDGDVVLIRSDAKSPINDRLLVGVYDSDADWEEIGLDILAERDERLAA